MKLPGMRYSDGIKKAVQVKFGGYSHSHGAGDGEIYDMRNMSSANYPLLSVRPKRKLYKTTEKPGDIFGYEKLLYTDGTSLYYDGVLKGHVTEGKKRIAALGDRLIIFPDKKLLNVKYERKGIFGTVEELERSVTAPAKNDAYGVGLECPYELYVWDGDGWVNIGRELDELESEWSGGSLTFGDGYIYGETARANTVQNENVDWREYFREGDAVTISGCTAKPGNNKTPIIREISEDGHSMYFSEYAFELEGENGDAEYTESGELRIKRAVPELVDICVNDNRVWGCMDDTIYCSALGDPYNWNLFDGVETDSWACETGTPGSFTACCAYLGYPIFFKENTVCKVYGSMPSNFAPMASASLGVIRGGTDSLAVAGEILFYLSRAGVVAYSGGVPSEISGTFGEVKYTEAIGGSDGLKYYVSMREMDGAWSMFVYDTTIGLWHREDETEAIGFAFADGLYFLAADGKIWLVEGKAAGAVEEEKVEWFVEFGDFTDGEADAKALSKIQVRLELSAGAAASVKIKYDSEDEWQTVHTVSSISKRSVYLPVIPRRADHYRLKIEGSGECRIYSIAREYYTGSAIKTVR